MSVDAPQAAPAEQPRPEAAEGEPSRAVAFREQIADLKIPAPNAGRDKLLARLGGLLAALGIVLGVIGYFMSHNTDNSLSQNDAQTLAVVGLSCAVVGAAVFVRYSLANFLRLWLIRLIHEQQRRD
jgi:uncharacterized membrane protein YeaQ/YmgE (transglycosylase-associated protein family)